MLLRNINQQLELDTKRGLYFLRERTHKKMSTFLQPVAPIVDEHLIVLLNTENFLQFGQVLVRRDLLGTEDFAERNEKNGLYSTLVQSEIEIGTRWIIVPHVETFLVDATNDNKCLRSRFPFETKLLL